MTSPLAFFSDLYSSRVGVPPQMSSLQSESEAMTPTSNNRDTLFPIYNPVCYTSRSVPETVEAEDARLPTYRPVEFALRYPDSGHVDGQTVEDDIPQAVEVAAPLDQLLIVIDPYDVMCHNLVRGTDCDPNDDCCVRFQTVRQEFEDSYLEDYIRTHKIYHRYKFICTVFVFLFESPHWFKALLVAFFAALYVLYFSIHHVTN